MGRCELSGPAAQENAGRAAMIPIEQASFWLAGLPPREYSPLVGPADTDVAIIGGGLTGFWTAIFLKELDRALDVIILEQGMAGHGASGRNGGMLSETLDHSHELAIKHFGMSEARLLADEGEANLRGLTAFIRDRGIECHYVASGRLKVALAPEHIALGHRSVQVAKSLGISTFRMLGRDEIRAELNSERYLGALEVRTGGILDPARLVDGLRREAARLGVRVFEKTTVESLQKSGAGAVIRANGTKVQARRIVLATSAYTHHLLPSILPRFIPLYDYIAVSEPLSAAQWAQIGWRRQQGVTDFRTFFNYYRPTADGRVLWGLGSATYHKGNRVDATCDHSPRNYEALRQSWSAHFPALADIEWHYRWGGAICSTTRFTPFFGRALGGRACYGLGYTGHGLGTTRVAGRILAHMALDRPSDLLEYRLVTSKPFPYPPEPLRSWAVTLVSAALRKVDAGESPNAILRLLDRMGLGFSS